MKVSALDKIRQKYQGDYSTIKTQKHCPKCFSVLSIEDTEWFHVEMCENCFGHLVIEDSATCCNKQNLQKVKLICSNGTIQVRQQCLSCGDVTGNAIKLSKEDKEPLPVINTELRDSYFKRKHEQKSTLFKKFSDQKRDRWFNHYSDYLKSPEWEEKRLLVLKRDKYLCQCCLDSYATQVHHKSYEFVDLKGSEPAFDLVAICKPCHDKIELMKKNK